MAEQQQQGQQGLAVREKREAAAREERTVPGRFYVPPADVWETEDALAVAMEVPGVARDAVTIELKEDVLRVEARVDASKYEGLEPLYTEYGVGHWARAFALPDGVDRERIEARLEDGVLTLTLPKAAGARPRRIALA
jgi:HSP20 family protein